MIPKCKESIFLFYVLIDLPDNLMKMSWKRLSCDGQCSKDYAGETDLPFSRDLFFIYIHIHMLNIVFL